MPGAHSHPNGFALVCLCSDGVLSRIFIGALTTYILIWLQSYSLWWVKKLFTMTVLGEPAVSLIVVNILYTMFSIMHWDQTLGTLGQRHSAPTFVDAARWIIFLIKCMRLMPKPHLRVTLLFSFSLLTFFFCLISWSTYVAICSVIFSQAWAMPISHFLVSIYRRLWFILSGCGSYSQNRMPGQLLALSLERILPSPHNCCSPDDRLHYHASWSCAVALTSKKIHPIVHHHDCQTWYRTPNGTAMVIDATDFVRL